MPRVRVCIWNIQNYGTENPTKWGPASDLRNRFIRAFVRDQQIDVLLVQEVSENGGASVRDLILWLVGAGAAAQDDWAESFCGSALTRGAADPPANAGQVQYLTGQARSEGYAVLWRTNQATFRLANAVHRIYSDLHAHHTNPNPPAASPLNLSTDGRPAGFVPGTHFWDVQGGYRQPNAYPYNSAGGLMGHWPQLMLPTTGKTEPARLEFKKVRRPAYVVLELTIAPPDPRNQLVPVAAYHAPSRENAAEWGAYQACLARELYVTNQIDPNGDPVVPAQFVSTNRNVMGGDFNYEVDLAHWPEWYRDFVTPLSRWPHGGAACTEAPAHGLPAAQRATTVSLMQADHVTPETSGNLDNYLRLMIDLAFFPAGCAAQRVNIPAQLIADPAGGRYSGTLQALHAHLTGVVAGLAGANRRLAATGPEQRKRDRHGALRWFPMITGNWGATFVNWATFMNQLQAGDITNPRQACEFYALFISDHLPLVVDVNF
jgi:hypothetical protein